MKDMTGREIVVGDQVVYTSSPYGSPRLTTGRALVVEDHRMQVARDRCGNDVVDGKRRKWVWDPKTQMGHHDTVPARHTWVQIGRRCLVVDKSHDVEPGNGGIGTTLHHVQVLRTAPGSTSELDGPFRTSLPGRPGGVREVFHLRPTSGNGRRHSSVASEKS